MLGSPYRTALSSPNGTYFVMPSIISHRWIATIPTGLSFSLRGAATVAVDANSRLKVGARLSESIRLNLIVFYSERIRLCLFVSELDV